MSELDLGLKVGVRRLFWAMGLSTRMDVQLRGWKPTTKPGSRAAESFTDLDVLGFALTNGYSVSTAVADCKTSQRDSTSRMFWVRGVADLFQADHAYLVREHEVTDAARQLSTRLDVTVLTSADLSRTQSFYDLPGASQEHPLSALFDRAQVEANLHAFRSLDRRLKPLLDFREFDYWVIEPHRSITQLIAHTKSSRALLDSRHPAHVALFLDLAWLTALSLIKATEHVRSAYLGDVDRGLQEYLFGGSAALREKQQVAKLFASIAPKQVQDFDVFPEYFAVLRELVTRLLRRPTHLQGLLRALEATSAFVSSRRPPSRWEAAEVDVTLSAKLAADVCGFLVTAADLDPSFRSQARRYLVDELPSDISAATTVKAQIDKLPARGTYDRVVSKGPVEVGSRNPLPLPLVDLED